MPRDVENRPRRDAVDVRLRDFMDAVRCRLKQQFLECAAGSRTACNDAYSSVRPVLGRVIRRVALLYNSGTESEDILQEALSKMAESGAELAQALPEEEPALLAYLSILAANTARDWFRARGAAKRGFRVTHSLDGLEQVAPHLVARETPMDKSLLFRQIEASLEGDPREVLVFRLHYRQGFTASEIARIPAVGLSTKGVESVLTRMRSRLRAKLSVEGKSPEISSS